MSKTEAEEALPLAEAEEVDGSRGRQLPQSDSTSSRRPSSHARLRLACLRLTCLCLARLLLAHALQSRLLLLRSTFLLLLRQLAGLWGH